VITLCSLIGDRDLARKIVPRICVKLDWTITNRTFFNQESLAKIREKVNCLPGYAMRMETYKAQGCCEGQLKGIISLAKCWK